jgi:hypothetical protein
MATNKRKCKNCNEVFEKQRPLQFVCSPTCATQYGNKQRLKQVNKEWKEEKKVLVEKLKTLGEYEKEAKVFFQHWIRLRDADQNCISCGTAQTDLWDGGHFKKAELYSGTIFYEPNCHKQCRKCNRYLGGNELNYREGLVKRYGEDYVLTIEKTANELRQYKYSKDELIEIRNKYQKLVAEWKRK